MNLSSEMNHITRRIRRRYGVRFVGIPIWQTHSPAKANDQTRPCGDVKRSCRRLCDHHAPQANIFPNLGNETSGGLIVTMRTQVFQLLTGQYSAFAALGDRLSCATATFYDTLVLLYYVAAHKQKDAYEFPAEYSPVQMPIASGDPMICACEADARRAGGNVCGATRIGNFSQCFDELGRRGQTLPNTDLMNEVLLLGTAKMTMKRYGSGA
ncbi:hypothetical protein EDB89DRAFT_1903688 [Lactarius sanguifluus]|nr:hypothetical protein EDB89DRAFT_1903688 [Lactarius sanguifluus]